jgi:3-oxoacyl-[acyl-carrier-protein] synthase-3
MTTTVSRPGACLLSTGMAIPQRIVPNTWFEGRVETSDEWIQSRTGIRERRFADPNERTSDYASRAALQALERSKVPPGEVGLVVVATTVPDMRLPTTANFVIRRLDLKNAYGYDVVAGCSGFLFALAGAEAQLRAGMARHALVIGAEIYSSILDFTDRNTCVLFGDGAGAVLLGPPGSRDEGGILRVQLFSQGEHTGVLGCEGGGTAGRRDLACASGDDEKIYMDGPMVFRLAVEGCCNSIRKVLDAEGLGPSDLARIIPHQANYRIIEKIARTFDYPMERIEVNLDRHGNTAAASIPIALNEAVTSGRSLPGDLIMLVAAGAGFNSGAVLLRL